MSYVVVDTDVASAILKNQLHNGLARRLAGQQLAITFVTVGELTQWTYLRRWGSQRRAGLRAFFASVVVLPSSFQVATVWGEIQAHARLRGRPRPINDSWIAACCLARELPLATLNTKDYTDYAEHERPRTRPLTIFIVECLVERTTAHGRSSRTRPAI